MATQQDIIALAELLSQSQREQMPWERLTTTPAHDMFGSMEDNPLVRRAREMEHDRAIASETFKARSADPRAWETQQSIADEVFGPISQAYGTDIALAQGRRGYSATPRSASSDFVKSGSTVLQRNPTTGELDVVYEPPNPFEARAGNDLAKDRRAKLKGEIAAYNSALLKLDRESPVYDDDRRTILRNIVKLQEEWRDMTSDPTPDISAEPEPEAPSFGRGFIGSPGGSNAFENPFERGLKMGGGSSAAPAKVKRYQFDPTTGKIK